jgi:zinc transport system substrate-binding protein
MKLLPNCLFPVAVALLVVIIGGCHPSPTANRLASATSYLESAAQEFYGGETDFVRLAEPGTCPGHFDIRPSQAADLRRCRALVRFDFQSSLDKFLDAKGTNGPTVVAVEVRRGLGLPESYLSACRQISESFVAHGFLERTNADATLLYVAARLESLAREATNQVAQAGFVGQAVITSVHQKDFCEWLGLKVVATFRAADTASVAEIDAAISAGQLADVKLVIANLPEGRRTADALAERLGARVAVFGNFPALERGRVYFDDLVRTNVAALFAADRP